MLLRAWVFIPRAERAMLEYAQRALPGLSRFIGRQIPILEYDDLDLAIQLDLRGKKDIEAALEFMTRCNEIYLLKHPSTPRLYQSGVRYEYEPKGEENWLTIPVLYRYRYGDCEDLACALSAERRRAGIPCSPYVTRSAHVWHIRVKCETAIEDPSLVLGMR